MNIREVIQTLNQMQSDGVVGRCAVGGAVAASFYLEPFATLDVDSRHGLEEKWERFSNQFLSGS